MITKEERTWAELNFRLAYQLLDPTLPEKDQRPKVKHELGHMPANELLQEVAVMLKKLLVVRGLEEKPREPLDKEAPPVIAS